MKKYSISAFCLLLMGLLLQSCAVDNIDPTSENTLKVNGETFEVTMASLLGISLEGEGHAALTFTGTNGVLTKVLTIDFEYSPSEDVSGTYAYPSASGSRNLNNFLTNYTEMPVTGAVYATNLEKGTVTVKDNGDSNYTITMDLLMNDGKVFKGTYRGEVQTVFNNG
jgi:hypothetical protein